MIKVELDNLTIDESIVKDDKNALQKAYFDLTEKIKEQIGKELSYQLNSWQTPPDVLVSYPFFQGKARLVVDYLACLDVLSDGKDGITLAMNTQALKTKKLPGNLHNLLEYGNKKIQPLPHIRPVLFRIKEYVAETLKSVQK